MSSIRRRDPAGSEPGGREPAPGSLRLVQRFVNSYDSLTGKELMGTPLDLERWLRRMGFPSVGRPVGPPQLAAMHHLRGALRRILAGHNGGHSDPDAIEAVNRAFARPALSVVLDPAGNPATSASDAGVAGLIAALQQAVLEAGAAGTWDRLKACPECGWVFYDHSRNRSGEWCTMAICGSRAKMRAYRRRKTEAVPDQARTAGDKGPHSSSGGRPRQDRNAFSRGAPGSSVRTVPVTNPKA